MRNPPDLFTESYPVPKHPAWNIIDSSKLSDTECWRMFFYKHILGWQLDQPNVHLVFGEAWHAAREHMLLHGYDDLQGAYKAFCSVWYREFDDSMEQMYPAKSPLAAAQAIAQFAGHYQRDLIDNKVLYTEISGSVPIDPRGRLIFFRMDSVIQNLEKGYVFSWDHKTKGGPFNQQWEDDFFLSWQNGTYTHCLYCLYPIEQVKGVEFCGTSFKHLKKTNTTVIDFRRVPAFRNPRQMNIWLWNTIDLYDRYEYEMHRLSQCSDSDPVMQAFPINPGRCSKYFGCEFKAYCQTWANPLRHCEEPPLGFKIRFWDPTELDTTNKMDLEAPK